MAPPVRASATNHQETSEAASGRPAGVGTIVFGSAALRLLDNGYQPLPLVPAQKRPALPAWPTVPIDVDTVERWARTFPAHGIGLRTGHLVGVDVDILDPDLAHRVDRLVRDRLGDTLTRVGFWPKRLLPYRIETPVPKMTVGGPDATRIEVLGLGQQFVAFGIHPGTGEPYSWAEDTPLDVPFAALPVVTPGQLEALSAEIGALLPRTPGPIRRGSRRPAGPGSGVVRDGRGRVTDGRDGWLSAIAFHAVHDAMDADGALDVRDLALRVWDRFAATTDLDRPAAHGAAYGYRDAEAKVADKLRLLAGNRLPPRTSAAAEASFTEPILPVTEARARLEGMLGEACDRIEAWHADPGSPPRIGIKATVGLGKSAGARRALLAMRRRLLAAGRPARLLVLTPSHALAEEAAEAWRAAGLRVAVLRGYEATDPASRAPMCRDLPAVRAAIDARLAVHDTACTGGGRRCAYFDHCLKQLNRAEVAAADVVVAAHQALFTGFAVETGSIAAVVIDEALWSSAVREPVAIPLDTFVYDLLALGHGDDTVADLHDLRGRAGRAFADCGPVARARLLEVGLDEEACRLAASLEARRLRDPGLYPGMPEEERRRATVQAAVNARTHAFIELWQAMAELAGGGVEHDGRLLVRSSGKGTEVLVATMRTIHPTLRDRPMLHLDATLRPELAERVLPGLVVEAVEAAAPHMSLRLVTGSFGKGSLCQEPRLEPAEARRRANRLRDVVDYVGWQVRRVAPAPVLVVTYKACEAAFDIPGVETAHFNAIAGLDAYRDVRLLIVIGRPLPSDQALAPLAGALFGHLPGGGYAADLRAVRMRDGSSRAVRVSVHEDARAELLRAAICDDEVLQAIGRGRGVNRSADDPLEVQLLADVALPLVHDRIVPWDMVRPCLFQRMLLQGIAVDSPADAAVLYPGLFANVEQAKKAIQRVFGGHFPIGIPYREMSLKSAAYRRVGRGRSWQRAWWLTGDGEAARNTLEAALVALAGWKPD